MVLLGLQLRLVCSRGDVWLDEIWSLQLARLAGTAAGVFTLHHDNNHHLNTLWILLVGSDAPAPLLRLAAVAAGTASLLVVARRPLGGSRSEALAALGLSSLSHLMVHYGSEARGYALAAFFGLTALLAMARYLETRRWLWAALFGAVSVLGLLSHLTFLLLLLGFAAWAAAEFWQTRRNRPPGAAIALLVLPPAAALALLWWIDLRQLVIGGAAPYEVLEVLRELLRTALGIPAGPLELLGLLALAGAVLEIWHLARSGRAVWLFFAATLLVAPALVAAARPGFLAPRYFLVIVPGFLLLLGRALARLQRRARAGQAAAVLALLLFAVGNGLQIARLRQEGRGQYHEAFAWLVSQSPRGSVITIGSDHDWRTRMVLGHVARELPVAERVEYMEAGNWTADAPRWILRHDFADRPSAEPGLRAYTGRRYVLDRQFGYAGLSGWNWYLYRIDPAP